MGPVIPILFVGGLIAFAIGSGKKGGGGGGNTNAGITTRDGILMVKDITTMNHILAGLAGKNVESAGNRTIGGATGEVYKLTNPPKNVIPMALSIVTQKVTNEGKHALISTRESFPALAFVNPGGEVEWCAPSRNEWALFIEAGAAPAVQPAGPNGGVDIGPVEVYPVDPNTGAPVPVPGVPGGGPTIPGGFEIPGVTQGPDGGWTLPGGINIPPINIPGVNLPGGGAAPPVPGGPGGGAPPGGGVIDIPGLGPVQIPGGLEFPVGLPGVPGAGTGAGGATAFPSSHLFTIRAGDIPSRLAQWYTGDFKRAEELRVLNNLAKMGSGTSTYYTPWRAGQIIKLPLTWDVSKGLPPKSN